MSEVKLKVKVENISGTTNLVWVCITSNRTSVLMNKLSIESYLLPLEGKYIYAGP